MLPHYLAKLECSKSYNYSFFDPEVGSQKATLVVLLVLVVAVVVISSL